MQENNDKITEISERIRYVIDYLKVTTKDFSVNLGYTRPQSIYDFLSGRVKPSFEFFQMFGKSELCKNISLQWLITGEGEMVKNNAIEKYFNNSPSFGESKTPYPAKEVVKNTKNIPFDASTGIDWEKLYHDFKSDEIELKKKDIELILEKAAFESNAEPLNISEDNELEIIKRVDGTEFRHLGDERYLMITPLVEHYAYAGYISGWSDPSYLEELPRHAIVVDRLHFGIYRSFTVRGDSMDNGLKESISDGDIVTGRRVDQKFWKSKLHIHKFMAFAIHSVDGLIIKKIIEHDVENGIITIQSLNTDKDSYPDTQISLQDVNELYNIVLVTQKRT